MGIRNSKTGEVTHQGLVLSIRDVNILDMYADEVLAWDPVNQKTTAHTIMGDHYATVDATPEVKDQYNAFLLKKNEEYLARVAELKLKTLKVGATVKVVRGRKVPKGTVAVIRDIRTSANYTMIVLDNGQATYKQNVEILVGDVFVEPASL